MKFVNLGYSVGVIVFIEVGHGELTEGTIHRVAVAGVHMIAF